MSGLYRDRVHGNAHAVRDAIDLLDFDAADPADIRTKVLAGTGGEVPLPMPTIRIALPSAMITRLNGIRRVGGDGTLYEWNGTVTAMLVPDAIGVGSSTRSN